MQIRVLMAFMACVSITVPRYLQAQAQAWEWLNPRINGNNSSNIDILPYTNTIVISYPENLLVSYDQGTLWTTIETGYSVTGIKQCSHKLIFGFTSNGGIIKNILHDNRKVVYQRSEKELKFNDILIDTVSGFGLAVGGYEVWEPHDQAYTIHNWGIILQTHDFGDHWEIVYEKSGDKLNGILKQQSGYTVYGTERVNFVIQSSNGSDWTFIEDFGLGEDVINKLQYMNGGLGFLHYKKSSDLYYTNNGGKNWMLKHDFDTEIIDLAISGTTIAATSYSSVFVSFDGGNTWKKEDLTPPSPSLDRVLVANDIIIVTGQRTALYLALNNTSGFRNINEDFYYRNIPPSAYSVHGRNHAQFVSENVGYTLISNSSTSTLLKTTDGGCSWQDVRNIPDDYHTVLHFRNEAKGVRATNGSIYYTENGGVTWTRSIDPIAYSDYRILALDFFTESIGIAMTSDEMIRTTDGGKTWTNVPRPFYYYSTESELFILNATTAFIALPGDIYIKTENAGETWTTYKTGINMDWHAAYFNDTQNGFLAGSKTIVKNNMWVTRNVICRTSNGGATWSEVATLPQTASKIKFKSYQEGYVLGTSGMLLKTIDGGKTWTPEKTVITQDLENIFFFDEVTYLTGDFSTIVKKSNIPTANFQSDLVKLCQGESIVINNKSSNATTYLWKLDGVEIARSKDLQYNVQTTAGMHTLELTSGSCNLTTYDQKQQSIQVLETPKPTLLINDRVAGSTEYLCDSTYTISTQKYESYFWSTGSTSAEVIVGNESSLSVKVTMDKCSGTSDTLLVERLPNPAANFAERYDTKTNEVRFTNRSTNGQRYLWDFGDGSTSDEISPNHIYSENSLTYDVTLIAQNNCATDTLLRKVNPLLITDVEKNINEKPVVYPNPTRSGTILKINQPAVVAYTISSVNGVEIQKSVPIDKSIILPTLSAGIYILSFYDTRGKQAMHRLIIY